MRVRQSNSDRKWDELSRLLQNNSEMFDAQGHRRKLVIFTEHRDTLNYLAERIRALIGRPEAVVTIHGGLGREERKKAQAAFTYDKDVEILVATDAAGEGINLQRAHLMVNYDLPWNPNRLEHASAASTASARQKSVICGTSSQRRREKVTFTFGYWKKLAEEREALGGQVFDVLGTLKFEDRSLRELLLEAIRYGDRPEIRARLYSVVDKALDRQHLRELIENRALAGDSMDVTKVREIREEMERADARRLQPHFIASFFLEALRLLGGSAHEREPKRYEIKHVPNIVRTRDRALGRGEPVLQRYERITFEKGLISLPGKPQSAFVCPGHPLLDASIDLILERHRDLLKRGAMLIDDSDEGIQIRAMVLLEHSIQDASTDPKGNRRIVSRRLQFIEIDERGTTKSAGPAPYLDYRPPTEEERPILASVKVPNWIQSELENKVMEHATINLVPKHFEEVREGKERLIKKTIAAVKDRLTIEINHWDHRATELKEKELAGHVNARLNSGIARQRADELAGRLRRRLEELEQERRLAPLPPIVRGGAIVIPRGLLRSLQSLSSPPPTSP